MTDLTITPITRDGLNYPEDSIEYLVTAIVYDKMNPKSRGLSLDFDEGLFLSILGPIKGFDVVTDEYGFTVEFRNTDEHKFDFNAFKQWAVVNQVPYCMATISPRDDDEDGIYEGIIMVQDDKAVMMMEFLNSQTSE